MFSASGTVPRIFTRRLAVYPISLQTAITSKGSFIAMMLNYGVKYGIS
jgi:hypothetical protein